MEDENGTVKNLQDEPARTQEKPDGTAGNEAKAARVMDADDLKALMNMIGNLETLFSSYANTFTSKDRTRLIGGGIKNFGFIQTAHRSAAANPQFVPPYLNMKEFTDSVQDFSSKSVLLTRAQQFAQQVADSMLLSSDTGYHYAVEYYSSVKEATRQRVPGAEAEYKLLSRFFKKGKPSDDGAEPTHAQIERDVAGLLHGTKEGRIVIENENPDLSGGKRRLVDETHSEHAASKTIIEGDGKK
jgi:hypothetical protein